MPISYILGFGRLAVSVKSYCDTTGVAGLVWEAVFGSAPLVNEKPDPYQSYHWGSAILIATARC